ncbi:hypothetical protein Scep_017280 [Stephania cephalantha]|uniref:SET domain-containing protein n=1 Tax=Stephania cephalantha TaxID=152367 RepID=A0AAP0IPB6_9MAGN
MEEEMLQQLRSKATELLLREEWIQAINVYSQLISLCQQNLSQPHQTSDPADRLSKLHKSLSLAFSNRADARSRLRDFDVAIEDCERALEIEGTHYKALLCKGKILLNLNRYSDASHCFQKALFDNQSNGSSETLQGYLDRCKKLEFQSKTGAFDLSEWVLNGFKGKSPELAEFIGSVEIKRSENIGGRGLFTTKNVEAGTLLFVTRAVATGRGILPEPGEDADESARLVMWKDFIDKIVEASMKCGRTYRLICTLSSGEREEDLGVPDISLFRPEADELVFTKEKPDMGKILSILDVNSLTEDAISATVLGRNKEYSGVGLWILASFINHSCNPNARRLHVGDHMMVHASRDIKAGEEITFAYFDVLVPLRKRREMSKTWGFQCNCKRCRFEEVFGCREELREIEMVLEFGGSDKGALVFKLEEWMKKWVAKGKEKGYLRASFWAMYSEVFKSEKSMRRWGRRMPAIGAVAENVAEAVGADERVVQTMAAEGLRKSSDGGSTAEMERAMKLGRGICSKAMKKQATRAYLELCLVQD